MKETRKRQIRVKGALVEVPLASDLFAFGVLLDQPLIAFLDIKPTEAWQPEFERNLESLFKLDVYIQVISKGVWLKVGKIKLDDFDAGEPFRYVEDVFTKRFSLYHSTKFGTDFMVPCEEADTAGLEVMAVWDACHVEERLREHFGIL